jgi:menaquinone-9 beta-reductase
MLSLPALRHPHQEPMRVKEPALVIGGGVAGAAVTVHLARAGRSVILIERKMGPHDKVCGEFLSGEAASYLRDIDIDLESLGAVRISEVRLYSGERVVTTRLPFPAFGLSRRVLDEALLHAASDAGGDVLRGEGVQFLRREDRRWFAQLGDGRIISASDVFLATGKHDLKDYRRPTGRQGDFIAFKLHWHLTDEETKALESAVELILFPGGYAGLGPVEKGVANLCLVVQRDKFTALGRKWDLLLAALCSACPHIRRRLMDAQRCWPHPLAITALPYGFIQTRAGGLWRLGDQGACIPSFCGNGISIAVHSAHLAAQHYLAGYSPESFQSRLASDIAPLVKRATLLSQMLTNPLGRAISFEAARVVPDLLGAIAHSTRIPARHLSEGRFPS